MTEYLPRQFEKLKAELLALSGIKQIIPSDCKRLSANIYHKTHLQVSETTLKRVFGFACSEFRPSAFTVSAIAQFCGYTGWSDFVDTLEQDAAPAWQCSTWDKINSHAKKITAFTLQTLRNRSGIPFAHTIPRDPVNQHIDIFSNGPYTSTVLSAPAGYGKTTALCHWADLHGKLHPEDIVLYYKFNNVPGTTKVNDLNAFLLAMLGMQVEGNIFEAGFFETLQPKGKFYLIVDGLNDAGQKRGEIQHVFAQLNDVVSLYRNYSWFKMIVSMRASTWIDNRHQIINNTNAWFLGFMNNQKQAVNIPLLDAHELSRLSANIDPLNNVQMDTHHIAAVAHPLYFQYFYQLHQQDAARCRVGAITVYQTVTAHVVQHVYRGRYNDDKVILLRTLTDHLTDINGSFRINKITVNNLIKTYEIAFRELLSAGILRYADTSDGPAYDSYLEFADINLLHFAMAEKIIAQNNGRFDQQLLGLINASPCLKAEQLPVLKWCIYNMATTAGIHHIKWLTSAGINTTQQAQLLLLIGQLIRSGSIKLNNTPQELGLSNNDNAELFNYIIGAEFMDRDHELSLIALADMCFDEEQRFLIKLYLGMIAILKLDLPELEKQIDQLKSVSPAVYRCLPINPVHCLDSIYFYLKFGIIKKDVLADITRFYFNPATPQECTGNVNINSIMPMLGICAAILFQDPQKTVRAVSALQKVYPITSAAQDFLLDSWLSCALVKIDEQKALANYQKLSAAFKRDEAGYTSFMRISFYVLKIRMAIAASQTEHLLTELRSLIRLCDTDGQKLIKVTTLAHVLDSGLLSADPKLTEQLHYDLIRTTRGSSCHADSFLTHLTAEQHSAMIKTRGRG